jgi:hypothetical protein
MSSRVDRTELIERIERAYAESGNNLGWRFLASPEHVLQGAEVAFIGLNPGGSVEPRDHPRFAPSTGSAYVDESWAGHPPGASPLQRQVIVLFRSLGVKPEDVLAGNLVPFRSPDWARLQNRDHALSFGRELWRDVLMQVRPRLVIGMGREVSASLSSVMNARNVKNVRVGWGAVTGLRAETDGGFLVGLPHLSRFAIMKRPQSQPGLRALFGDQWL